MGALTNDSTAGKRIRHFVGVESSKQLAFIDDLHRLGLSRTVDLPELIVVGDQNTGKSSVLQAITEISFPVESALCTRFPIKISFRQTPGTSTSVQAEILPGPKTQDDDVFMERIKNFRFTSDELSASVMNQIIKEATDRIFGDDNGAGQTLSDAILRIERSGPHEMHWTIIDLPGLVQNRGESSLASKKTVTNAKQGNHTDNAKIAKDLVRSFLENERNIVLWVVDDTDIERHKTLELFEEIPGLQSRTIGVLTKCDRKQETSDNWMVKLLRNEPSTKNHLEQGWFGLRNRKPIEANISDEERDQNEADLFEKPEWAGIRKSQTGIRALMDHIDKERRSRIQESMPKIIGEIRDNLRNCEAELEKLGEVRDSTAAQRYYAFQFCTELQKLADSALRARYQDIPSDNPSIMLRFRVNQRLERFQRDITDPEKIELGLQFIPIDRALNVLSDQSLDPENWVESISKSESANIYQKIYNESKVCQGSNLPGTISPEVEEKIFRKQSAHWRDIAFDLVNDIKALVEECHDVFLRTAIPDSRTRGEVMAMISKAQEAWNAEVDAALGELIDDQQKRPLMTFQPYLLREYQRFDRHLWRQVEQSRRNAKARRTPGQSEADGIEDRVGSDDGRAQMSLELSQIFHVRKRLEVYYEIAMNRFVDNVAMQVVERHVLGPNCPLLTVSTKLLANLSDEDLHRIAGEDESVTRLRARLNKDRSSYKQALAQWDQVRYF
ncbi:dynamin family GTPase, putative [Talaromyces stipitatus ATCC 10500]|uniref:Dynamin family GTPase, putative n=1 Tax=Talaromyces stipitatus (strain ATCC 10500 / CBS 375.48 / QM 6759 / NRRL 1006) TaxID=441959 RepID=B8MBD4_TALSN|nr:dynamin family GTPase, putative [Talaromyces stipitatus ATCC 10500]EED18923.1 dynamin family GTPase, putative [Talaromyces stipitatus ATCC 10500]